MVKNKQRGEERKVAIVILYRAINETAQRGKFGKGRKRKGNSEGKLHFEGKQNFILFNL